MCIFVVSQAVDDTPPLWLIDSHIKVSRKWMAADRKEVSYEADNHVSFTETFWKPEKGSVERAGAGVSAELSEREKAGWEEVLARSMKTTVDALTMLGRPVPSGLAVSSQLKFPVQKGEKICRVCGKKFGTSSILSLHMSAHTLDYKFWCAVCKKGFTFKKTLGEHSKHCGQVPQFICLWKKDAQDEDEVPCQKAFHKAAHRAQHITEVHNQVFDAAVPCSFKRRGCTKSYTIGASKAAHERDCVYNPEYKGPYLCPLAGCDGECTRKKDIRQHLIKKHKIEPESYRLSKLLKEIQSKKEKNQAAKASKAKPAKK